MDRSRPVQHRSPVCNRPTVSRFGPLFRFIRPVRLVRPSAGPPCLARLVLVATAACALAGCAARPEPGPIRDGQWIWSPADQRVFLAARQVYPDLRPGLWVSTIRFDAGTGRLLQRLALPPTLVSGTPLSAVVRLDESTHLAWSRLDDATIERSLTAHVADLLEHLARSGARVAEVQLDYDCPTRQLARWAAVVRALKAGPLRGQEVWITSLLAHLRQPEYGDLFRGVVAGHILQVFDTGHEATPALVSEAIRLLDRQRLPFRLGVGAFERVLDAAATTDHRAWFAVAGMLSRLPGYRGLWVFPAGRQWTYLRGLAQ